MSLVSKKSNTSKNSRFDSGLNILEHHRFKRQDWIFLQASGLHTNLSLIVKTFSKNTCAYMRCVCFGKMDFLRKKRAVPWICSAQVVARLRQVLTSTKGRHNNMPLEARTCLGSAQEISCEQWPCEVNEKHVARSVGGTVGKLHAYIYIYRWNILTTFEYIFNCAIVYSMQCFCTVCFNVGTRIHFRTAKESRHPMSHILSLHSSILTSRYLLIYGDFYQKSRPFNHIFGGDRILRAWYRGVKNAGPRKRAQRRAQDTPYHHITMEFGGYLLNVAKNPTRARAHKGEAQGVLSYQKEKGNFRQPPYTQRARQTIFLMFTDSPSLSVNPPKLPGSFSLWTCFTDISDFHTFPKRGSHHVPCCWVRIASICHFASAIMKRSPEVLHECLVADWRRGIEGRGTPWVHGVRESYELIWPSSRHQ